MYDNILQKINMHMLTKKLFTTKRPPCYENHRTYLSENIGEREYYRTLKKVTALELERMSAFFFTA